MKTTSFFSRKSLLRQMKTASGDGYRDPRSLNYWFVGLQRKNGSELWSTSYAAAWSVKAFGTIWRNSTRSSAIPSLGSTAERFVMLLPIGQIFWKTKKRQARRVSQTWQAFLTIKHSLLILLSIHPVAFIFCHLWYCSQESLIIS